MKTQKTFLVLTLLITSLSFGQNNTYPFPQTGSVGIGTSPSLGIKFEVDGNTKVTGTGYFSSNDTDAGGAIALTNGLKNGPNNANQWQIYNMTGAYGNGLNFWAYGNTGYINGSKVTFLDNGNVGIGTPNPQAKLDLFSATAVNGPILSIRSDFTALGKYAMIRFGDQSQTSLYQKGAIIYEGVAGSARGQFHIALNNDDTSNSVTLNDAKLTVQSNGRVGIGTIEPNSKLDVQTNMPNPGKYESQKWSVAYNTSNSLRLQTIWEGDNGINQEFVQRYGDTDYTSLAFYQGKVGIGTSHPDEKLTVKGKIHAEEIIVTANVIADYVFQKYYTGKSELKSDYTMPTLDEVAQFTKVNNHLPNIPSAKEIQQTGVSLGEMSNILLQKVEELTLYAIEQQKQLERLKIENENYKSLAERLSALEKELKK